MNDDVTGEGLHDGETGTGAGTGTGAETGAEVRGGQPLPPRPAGSRPHVRVVRPGGSSRDGRPLGEIPPMPMTPPNSLPPWLAPIGPPGPAAGASPGAAAGAGAAPQAAGQPGPDPLDHELSPDERQLRELLHHKVGGLQPATGSLEMLRHAVPARRARRRRAYGGVATALLLGVLGGALLHAVADSADLAQGGPQATQSYALNANASSQPASGGAGSSAHTVIPYQPGADDGGTGGQQQPPGGGSQTGTQGATLPAGSRTGSTAPYPSSGSAAGSDPGGTPVAECTEAQLGDSPATVGTADADGTVYGSFQVSNVSQTTCQVTEPGTVGVSAVEGTVASRISIVQHTASDPATLLPVPSASPAPVVLAPGQAYVVDFAWVPATGADASSCTVTASPVSTATATSSSAASNTRSAVTEVTPTPSTSPTTGGSTPTVTLEHIPGAGGAPETVQLGDACAGTVYRTAPLATS